MTADNQRGCRAMDIPAMAKEFCEDWGLTTETRNDLAERLWILANEARNSALHEVLQTIMQHSRDINERDYGAAYKSVALSNVVDAVLDLKSK